MTFEEFFAKKKIDLVLLEKADPRLFNEFKSHFSLMGEKSFDHTKKFLFNRLRGIYHLPGPEKTTTATKPAIVTQAESISSTTIEQQAAFKPRFRSSVIAKAETPEDVPEKSAAPVSKPAFKPRNIVAKAVGEKTDSPETDTSAASPSAPKPMFRPRNIPTKAAEEKIEAPGTDEHTVAPIKKPAFKPRNIPTKAAEEKVADLENIEKHQKPEKTSETSVKVDEPSAEASTQAYKPKFKLKNISQKPAEDPEESTLKAENTPDIIEHIDFPEAKTEDAETETSDDVVKTDSESVVAFKPKFKLKNIKPKSPEE